jgi:hypothetical protein
MRKYYKQPSKVSTTPTPGLPSLLKIASSLERLEQRAETDYANVISSPMRTLIKDVRKDATQAIYDGERLRVEAQTLFTRVNELTTKKPHARKRIQKGGQLTAKHAQEMIRVKDKKVAKEAAEREAKMLKKIVNKEKKELHTAGVTARRCEKLRRKVLEEGNIIEWDQGSAMFWDPIPDPEAEWLYTTAQPITLPSSPPIRNLDSWLYKDVVLLD